MGTVPSVHSRRKNQASDSFAVVFDLDDTLIDHERWSFDRLAHVAADLGMSAAAAAAFLNVSRERLMRHEWTGLLEDIAETTGVPFHVLQESYSRQVGTDAAVLAHSRDCVRLLRATGIPVGVLSNNPSRQGVQAKLSVFGVPFDGVVAVWHEQRKPAADGFVQIAERLGVPVGSIVMVGDDGDRDIVGALRAGYKRAVHVALPDGRRDNSYRTKLSAEELTRCVEIASLSELNSALW